MVIYESHRNVSEEPRIRSQKIHFRRCVYLDALLKKLQKVAEIAYMSSKYDIILYIIRILKICQVAHFHKLKLNYC